MLRWCIGLIGLQLGVARALAGDAVAAVAVTSVREFPSRIQIDDKSVQNQSGRRVLLADGGSLLGWCEEAQIPGEGRCWVLRNGTALNKPPSAYKAWCVQPDLIAAATARWPVDAPLIAEVDSVTPDQPTAWVSAGTNAGIRVGQRWVKLLGGQPVARLDVRYVAAEVCFCRVEKLADGATVAAGERVQMWPGPGQARTGRAESWASFVEAKGRDIFVWVPAPAEVDVPEEPRVDFFRDGEYVGFGFADRRDDNFYYVRESIKARASLEQGIRVGDLARIRTREDIRAGRLAARVFERGPEGDLISAGEDDGIRVGQVLAVFRGGKRLGQVGVSKVQGDHAMVGPIAAAAGRDPRDSGPLGSVAAPLVRMDEVRMDGGTGPEAVEIGRVRRVVDGTLLEIDATRAGEVLMTPALVLRSKEPIAAAILVGWAPQTGLAVFLQTNVESRCGTVLPGDTIELRRSLP